MKIIVVLLFMCTLAFSKVYYAKVEPYEIRTLASNVSGIVLFTDENMIGKRLFDKNFITIDYKLIKMNYNQLDKNFYTKKTL